MKLPNIDSVRQAAERIAAHVHRTPVLTSGAINALYGADFFFKCENFQKVGAFKIRGAVNAVFSLRDAEAERGVATHSSGNHGAALALAARWRGIRAYVIMPRNAPEIKRAAVSRYGAEIFPCAPTLQAREEGLVEVVAQTGAHVVHPYNDPRIIAGQGTAALELCVDVPDLDAIIAPVGGGGLLGGTALAVRAMCPLTQIFGAEPEMADDALRSLQSGAIVPSLNPQTIADGLKTSLGDLTFAIIRNQVDAILPVSEITIVQAMRDIWERMKIVVEPSAAVALGAAASAPDRCAGKRVGVILSGGNIDLDHLPWKRAADAPV